MKALQIMSKGQLAGFGDNAEYYGTIVLDNNTEQVRVLVSNHWGEDALIDRDITENLNTREVDVKIEKPAEGGQHLNVNVMNRSQLIEAQEFPERYPQMTIRVSGYAVRFNALTKAQQDDVISRTFTEKFQEKPAECGFFYELKLRAVLPKFYVITMYKQIHKNRTVYGY